MSLQSLTEEQKRKIEENKQRAIAKRIERLSPVKCNIVPQDLRNAKAHMSSGTEGVVVSTGLNAHNQFRLGVTSSQPVNNNSTKYSKSGTTSSSQSFNNNSTNYSKSGTTSSSQSFNNNSTNYSKSGTTTNKYINRPNANHSAQQNFAVPKEKLSRTTLPTLSGKCVLSSNDTFTVEVGYSAALIQYFKQLKTRSYDPGTKLWSFKMEEYKTFMKGVQSFHPDIEIEHLPRWILQSFDPEKRNMDVIPTADLSTVDDKLVHTLLSFQRDSVNLAVHRNGRLLIADDMGLGKTLQAICIACYYRKEWPLLIVSPSSVRYDWAQQICKWLPSVAPCDINVVDTGRTSAASGIINIVSYDLLSKKASELKQVSRVMIVDESHFLKNVKTARTKAAAPLLKNAKRVLLLSGTPALSRPSELYSQITAVCPDLFKFHEFGLRYCNAKQMPWGWDYSGSSNMVELQLLLEKKVMIRRQKKDVLSQLPPKCRQVIMLDPRSVQKHKGLDVASRMMSNSKLKGLNKRGALLEYFHETCKSKLSAVRDYIMDLIEAEEKFLVFAHHKEMLDCIEDGIQSQASKTEYIRIDGRTTSEQRNFLCNKFQTSENYRVAILSITAANAGLNLSAANIVVFSELFWNPGILVQAEDRVHRIGQQDSVIVQYLVAQHTADDYIWPLVQNKLDILSKAGLTKDDFSDSDTKRLTDSTQERILDMFSREFMDDTVPELEMEDETPNGDISACAGVSPEKIDINMVTLSQPSVKMSAKLEGAKKSARTRTPQKSVPGDWTRKISPSYKMSSSQSNTTVQGDRTPTKRQASITRFFECTPPKKKLCLDDMPGLMPEQPETDESAAMKAPNITENENAESEELKSDDGVFSRTSWLSDDISSLWLADDINDIEVLEKSDEPASGSDRSPCMISQESRSSTPIVSQEDLLFMEDVDWDDDM